MEFKLLLVSIDFSNYGIQSHNFSIKIVTYAIDVKNYEKNVRRFLLNKLIFQEYISFSELNVLYFQFSQSVGIYKVNSR